MTTSSTTDLAGRFGWVQSHATLVESAILAAHGATARADGFRASDVRFFFLLFANWMERDVLRPGQDLELTQIRRALARLADARWLSVERAAHDNPRARRGGIHRLTEEGLVGLVSSLVAPSARPFEEVVFVASFALAYRDTVVGKVRGPSPISLATRRRVGELLSPKRIVLAARRRLVEAADDLDARVAAGLAMERQATAAAKRGVPDAEIAREVGKAFPYQLHGMRPFDELLRSLPEDLRQFELSKGLGLRARVLFRPLAAQVRAEIGILDGLLGEIGP
jgi:hypothetical protein